MNISTQETVSLNPGVSAPVRPSAPDSPHPSALNARFALDLTNEKARLILSKLEAVESHFSWQLLGKEIDGRLRSIVILGEQHLTSDEGLEKVDALLPHFPYRATEGIFVSNYPFEKAHAEYFEYRKKWLLKTYPDQYQKESALARTSEERTGRSEEIVNQYLEGVRKQISGEGEITSIAHLSISNEECEKIVKSLRQLVKSANNDDLDLRRALQPVEEFQLEANHRPDFWEKVEVAKRVFYFQMRKTYENEEVLDGGLSCTFLSPLLGALGYFTQIQPFYTAALISASIAGVFWAAPLSMLYLQKTRLIDYMVRAFDKIEEHSASRRNDTMCAEVNNIMNTTPDIDNLLFQVGVYHMSMDHSVGKILEDQHGWSIVAEKIKP